MLFRSLTSDALTPARSIAAKMATLPSSCAGRLDKAPLNEPTGVRAALAMTIVVESLDMVRCLLGTFCYLDEQLRAFTIRS